MNREQLIEKAAKALEEVRIGVNSFLAPKLAREFATMALKVFEEAHAPTDDEREALATILGEPVRGTLALADRILAAGFRRTVQGEPPLIECPHRSPGRITMRKGCTACESVQGEPRCTHPNHGKRIHECELPPIGEPQGEPMVEATHRGTFGHVWPCPLFYVGNWKRIENGHEPVRECTSPAVCAPATVQGEPTVIVATKPAIDAARKVVERLEDWAIQSHAAEEILSALDDIPDCESWTAVSHAEHAKGEPSAQVLAAVREHAQRWADRPPTSPYTMGLRDAWRTILRKIDDRDTAVAEQGGESRG